MDALGNFRYLVENEKVMEGRTRYLPWEFLVFVVDHRTPLPERKWAQQYYLNNRTRHSGWHKDVPYDKDMLAAEVEKTSGKKPHLEGREGPLLPGQQPEQVRERPAAPHRPAQLNRPARPDRSPAQGGSADGPTAYDSGPSRPTPE